jgi:hypothetical protein
MHKRFQGLHTQLFPVNPKFTTCDNRQGVQKSSLSSREDGDLIFSCALLPPYLLHQAIEKSCLTIALISKCFI